MKTKKLLLLSFGLMLAMNCGSAQSNCAESTFHAHDLEKLRGFLAQTVDFQYQTMDDMERTNGDIIFFKYTDQSYDWQSDDICAVANNLESLGVVLWSFEHEIRRIEKIIMTPHEHDKNLLIAGSLSGSFDFSGCTELKKVVVQQQEINSVDLSECPNLEWVMLTDNNIESVNFNNSAISNTLDISGNKILPSWINAQPKVLNIGNQEVTESDYMIVWRNDALYLMIDLSAESEFVEEFVWNDFLYPEEVIEQNGVFYFKLDDVKKAEGAFNVQCILRLDYLFNSGGQLTDDDVIYTFYIDMRRLNIITDQQTELATAYVYLLQDDEYILVETAIKTSSESTYIVTNSLPAGKYMIAVEATGYFFTYYSECMDDVVLYWEEATIISLCSDAPLFVYLKKKPVLVDEGIIISGKLEESLLKASTRLMQKSTVLLHQSNSADNWILVDTDQTDENGFYSFTGLPRGVYRITVEIPGYKSSEFIIVQANTADVTIRNQNFLVDMNEKTITANADQVMSEYLPDNEMQLIVYPNPAKDMVRINGLEGAYIVKIINMTGQVVTSVTGTTPDLTLRLDNLPSGMYLLRIESQGKLFIKKIIVF